MKIKPLIFYIISIKLISCNAPEVTSVKKNDTIRLSFSPETPFIFQGQYKNSKPVGVWIYKNSEGRPIQDVIYNYDKDSNQLRVVQKFLEDGKLICEESFFNDSLISIIYSCDDPLNKKSVKLNAERYCINCHQPPVDQGFTYKIDSLNYREVIAFVQNSDSLKKTSLKWASNLYRNNPNIDQVHNFKLLSKDEIKAILDYLSSPERMLDF